jgi:hypothetical protein
LRILSRLNGKVDDPCADTQLQFLDQLKSFPAIKSIFVVGNFTALSQAKFREEMIQVIVELIPGGYLLDECNHQEAEI